MVSFRTRLLVAMGTASLSDTELAWWLEVPRGTLQSWVRGQTPRETARVDECERRLTLLANSALFPIPHTVSNRYRRQYILGALRDADNTRISKECIA